MGKINRIVRDARIIDRRTSGLNALSKIHGIGLAAATAILTVCYPKNFTILDRRVLEQLGLSPSDTAKWTAERYINTYLPRVRECAERWGCSLRDADRALWGLSVQKRIDTVIAQSQRDDCGLIMDSVNLNS
jgi:thermostable 8-oxoguanine DNA glycosylase